MRVDVGLDGSRPSRTARQLVENLPWLVGTAIRFTSVAVVPSGLMSAPGLYMGPDAYDTLQETRDAEAGLVLDAAARSLADRGLAVETAVLHGSAATALAEDATEWHADLAVVGSHGYGGLRGLLAGSVSATVIDRAPCPVLIARRPTATRVLIAVDGSPETAQAISTIAAWPILRSLPTTVLAVATVRDRDGRGDGRKDGRGSDDRPVFGRRAAERIAGVATNQLRAAGMHAMAFVASGRPVDEIVRAARAEGADLIVVGSRGRTGLARLRLGSTARGIVNTTSVSVLVVPSHASAPGTRWH